MKKIFDLAIFNKRQAIKGRVSILIPTRFDSRYIIELCLKSIKKYTDYDDYQIIVCDAGVDDITRDYLSGLEKKEEIKLIKARDGKFSKDELAKAVDTEYYILMHDDIRILRKDWLNKRLILMNRSDKNAIVGSIVRNYSTETKRFLPLGLLVKTEVANKLGLTWGKQPEFDTGAIAYKLFFAQTEYRFVKYNGSRDIFHFSGMTWPKRKYLLKQNFEGLDKKLSEREKKIMMIREMLKENAY